MKVEKLIPEVYYSQSRDFSYIGRLLEILFNYMKTTADCVAVNPDSPNIDANQIELLALTLGFESKHKYTTKDLIYVIGSFTHLMRKKGTKEAISNAIKLLMTSQKIDMQLLNDADFILIDNNHTIEIKIPSQMTDTILLEDLFDYILPAGMLYKFNRIGSRPKITSTLSAIPTEASGYTLGADTSLLLSSTTVQDGGNAYMLLSSGSQPVDWESATDTYYKMVDGALVPIGIDGYVANTFYKKQANVDVGTILTGTVAES